ncbi:hypothetical protein PEC18_19160 [Paucibacter sp. O1-1]|nr:hypothetical protein [Paucibacter sp. O1-1]MDA3827910.1 hypothetical protein [Paucibacter sp. O1-1]
MLVDQPTRFPIDAAAPEAELPRGRSHFRRVELARPLPQATVEVRVIAQEAEQGRGHTVFKPVLYLLDGAGNIRETVAVEPLKLDIRPFRPTELFGCARVKDLQRFLVATTEKDIGSAFESGARDQVKAPTKGGFYYSTDAVKVKLPFVATGELVMTVSDGAKPGRGCEAPVSEAKVAQTKP